MSSRQTRLKVIEKIEKKRDSKLLVYFCGDRPILPANIAGDAIRPLYDHLLAFTSKEEKIESIDLFLYGIGGRLEVPWRIVTMIREFCENFNVIIPYKAYSAATLIALGADKIIMGQKGELSPIDPTLHVVVPEGAQPPPLPREIGVEDISSYITFMKERVGLTDQNALVQVTNVLAEKLTPVVLGQVQRAYSHIRLIARKLLALCRPPLEEAQIGRIVEALTEKIYLHGHGIGRKEAKEIELQVEEPDPQLEKLIWSLYLSYEKLLKMDTTADPMAYFKGDGDEHRERDAIIACIESTEKLHIFKGELVMRRIRRVPPNPTININLNLQLPQNIRPTDIPPQVQQIIQRIIQRGASAIRQQVIKELTRQAPVIRIDRHLLGGKWVEATD